MTLAVDRLVVGTDAWHADRRTGLGGSDAASIAGVGYQPAVVLWEEKRGLRVPQEDTPVLRWGRLLEPVIAQEWAHETGTRIRAARRMVRNRDWPVMFAHLDRRTPDGPLECKSSMSTRGWGESGTTQIPPHVYVQVQHQLACTRDPQAHVAALVGYRDFRRYVIPADPDFQRDLIDAEREFWSLVEQGIPPEPDGSEEYGAFLRRRYPTDSGEEMVATPEQVLLVEKYARTRANREQAEKAEAELAQRIQAGMTTATRLTGPGFHISWRQGKERKSVAWKNVAEGLLKRLSAEEREFVLSLNTEVKEGTRPWIFTTEVEEEVA